MLHSLRETKYDLLLLLLLRLLQPTQMKFKQQQKQQQRHSSDMGVAPKTEKLRFGDLQYKFTIHAISRMLILIPTLVF